MYKLLLSLLFNLLIISNLIAQTNETGSFEIDNRTRDYRVHLPPNFDANNTYPLVINMHGLSSNAFEQEFYSDFNRVADANDFVVCYPNGVDNSWSSGFGQDVDDVKFLSALIDTLAVNYSVDLTRVYSTGMSNGGFMSYKLACELSNRIAAIASVTGSMVVSEFENCEPTRSVPIMQIHGTADAVVQYEGNQFLVSVETLVEDWASKNGCNNTPNITPLEDTNMEDNSTVEHWVYEGCGDTPQVEFYRVENGGHTWPGSPFMLPNQVTNYDFDASDVIWEFFSRFQNDAATASDDILTNITVEVFPNPTRDFIQLQSDVQAEAVDIFNSNGQLVKTVVAADKLDIRSFASGLYWLKIQTSEGLIMKKVLKH